MSARAKGIALAVFQVLLVLSLGAKLLYDRATRPRGWAILQSYDPDLPIRGRYLTGQLRTPAMTFDPGKVREDQSNALWAWGSRDQWAYYSVRDGLVVADATGSPAQSGEWVGLWRKQSDKSVWTVGGEPVLFFITDEAKLPPLQSGDEMWVEVTLPTKGPPRPLRIALKHNGQFTPLNF